MLTSAAVLITLLACAHARSLPSGREFSIPLQRRQSVPSACFVGAPRVLHSYAPPSSVPRKECPVWSAPRSGSSSRHSAHILRSAAASVEPNSLATIEARYPTKGPHVKVAGKVLNPAGLYFAFVTFFWALVYYPPLLFASLMSALFDRRRRRMVDWVVHSWAKTAMLTCLYHPKVTGLENLPPASEAVMFIPNHTSFLDIFTLSGFIPRRLKYVSKVEILRIPLIGWAMRLAGHVAIRRSDRRSQMKTFKDTIARLADGNNMVTFAEGTRSKTGQLMRFKKGPFKMSDTAGVRIVPVSICDLHRWMPSSALLPLAFPRSVEIIIHPPVSTEGRSADEVSMEVHRAIDSGLPDFQKTKFS